MHHSIMMKKGRVIALRRWFQIIVLLISAMLGDGCSEGLPQCEVVLRPGYSTSGTLIGSDQCPIRDTEIEMTWVMQGKSEGPFSETTDELGRFSAGWSTILEHAFSCQPIDEIGADLPPEFQISKLERVDLSFTFQGVQHIASVEIHDAALKDFVPWGYYDLNVGSVVASDVDGCP
ncbi:MAG: hypothetical protein HY287_01725 [Planctomycetes bacterium]|nr:hypothetical protein [Planctomycetota bacterium]MBI3833028.1 hypothetical protein [Planctomycetota bacterium]